MVLGLKLIWLLFTKSGSLWVSWVKAHLIGHGSFWNCASTNSSGSWIWRKLLSLRQRARPWFFSHIGDGATTSFWYDNWTGLGPLLALVGSGGCAATGIPSSATVQEATSQGQWRISSRSRNSTISFLRDALPDSRTILNPSQPDSFSWIPGMNNFDCRSPHTTFSTASTFVALAPHPPEVQWHNLIWFIGRIPKHAFHAWILVRDRLLTRDKLHRLQPIQPNSCLLCNASIESREHLFFHCTYSSSLITSALHRSLPHYDFLSLLQWITRSTSCKLLRCIGLLLVQAAAYVIWRERNNRLHNSSARSHDHLLRDINTIVKAKLASLSKTSPNQPASNPNPTITLVWFGLQDGVPNHSFN